MSVHQPPTSYSARFPITLPRFGALCRMFVCKCFRSAEGQDAELRAICRFAQSSMCVTRDKNKKQVRQRSDFEDIDEVLMHWPTLGLFEDDAQSPSYTNSVVL